MSVSIVGAISEICAFAAVASGGAAASRAKGPLWRRSLALRVSPSVGSLWQAVFGSQTVWNRSNRCAGARGGARVDKPRWLRILDNHRRILNGGDDLQAAAAVGAVFNVDIGDGSRDQA